MNKLYPLQWKNMWFPVRYLSFFRNIHNTIFEIKRNKNARDLIRFETNSIDSGNPLEIDIPGLSVSIQRFMIENPDCLIRIIGHTDDRDKLVTTSDISFFVDDECVYHLHQNVVFSDHNIDVKSVDTEMSSVQPEVKIPKSNAFIYRTHFGDHNITDNSIVLKWFNGYFLQIARDNIKSFHVISKPNPEAKNAFDFALWDRNIKAELKLKDRSKLTFKPHSEYSCICHYDNKSFLVFLSLKEIREFFLGL